MGSQVPRKYGRALAPIIFAILSKHDYVTKDLIYRRCDSRHFFLDHIPKAETYPTNGQGFALLALEKTDP